MQRLEIHCDYSSRDYMRFSVDNGCLSIYGYESPDEIEMTFKKKETIKFYEKLVSIYKQHRETERSTSMSCTEKKPSDAEERKSLNIDIRRNGEVKLRMERGEGWSCDRTRVETNYEKLEKIIEFLNNNINLGDDVMETIVKINCLEEETDSVLVRDCNKGKNVVIETDIDDERNLIFLNIEDAVKMAKTILERYDNGGK